MDTLGYTEGRIAAAHRANGRDWTFGPEGTVLITTDPVLAEMIAAGLIAPHFVSATQQINGQDDYYRLTDAGRAWLTAAEQNTA